MPMGDVGWLKNMMVLWWWRRMSWCSVVVLGVLKAGWVVLAARQKTMTLARLAGCGIHSARRPWKDV